MQSPSGLSNSFPFFKSTQARIHATLDGPIRRSTSPYGVEFEKRGKFEIERREMAITIGWGSQRIGGDMMVVIAGRLMRDALRMSACYYVRNEQRPPRLANGH